MNSLYGDDNMLVAVYNCSPKVRKNGILLYYSLILAAYTIGCVFFRFDFKLCSVSVAYRLLIDVFNENGYFAAFTVLFGVKAVIFLTVYFLGYFCFGKPILYSLMLYIGVFYGQFAGYLYFDFGFSGMIIFLLSFLVFGMAVLPFLYYRFNRSLSICSSIFEYTFRKNSSSIEFNNKDNFIKTIITLLVMLIISSVQSLALRIIIYFAT